MYVPVRAVVSAFIVYIAFATIGVLMMQIPGTPHRRSLEQAMAMAEYRGWKSLTPAQQDAANAAFDDWLRIGRQAEWVEATLMPVIAATVALFIWRETLPFRWVEIAIITLGFAILQMWRANSMSVDLPMAVGVVLLAATLALSQTRLLARWQRKEPLTIRSDA